MNDEQNPQTNLNPSGQAPASSSPPAGREIDSAISVTNTFATGKTELDKKLNQSAGNSKNMDFKPSTDPTPSPKKDEEVQDLFEEGLEFEPEPDKAAQQSTSMKDIKPVGSLNDKGNKLEEKQDFASTLPNEDKDALNSFQDSAQDTAGFQQPQTQAPPQMNHNYPTEPPTNPPQPAPTPPRRRSFCGLIIMIIIIFILLGGGGFAYFTYFAKVALTVKFNVNEIEAKVDGKDYSSQISNDKLKLSLAPGTHKFEFSKEQYFTYKKSLNVSKIPNKTLDISLRSYPEPTQLIQYEASDIAFDKDNSYIFYKSNSGKTLYRIKVDSGKGSDGEAITPDTMAAVTRIIWAPDFKSAIMKVTQGDKVDGTLFAGQKAAAGTELTFVYDFASFDKSKQAVKFLGSDIGNAAWASNDSIYFVQGQNVLKTDKNLSENKTVWGFSDQAFENPKIAIPSNEKYIALVPQSGDATKNNLYLFNTDTSEVNQITKDGGILDSRFNTDGNMLLFSATDASEDNISKQKIQAYLLETQETKDLGIKTTLEKTAFSDAFSVLFATYNQSSKTDDLENMDTSSKDKITYPYQGKEVTFRNLLYSLKDKFLYFINNNLLYSLKLDDGEY